MSLGHREVVCEEDVNSCQDWICVTTTCGEVFPFPSFTLLTYNQGIVNGTDILPTLSQPITSVHDSGILRQVRDSSSDHGRVLVYFANRLEMLRTGQLTTLKTTFSQ